MKKIFICFFCCMLLTGCSVSSPEKTVDSFMKAFKENDINALLDTIEPTTAQQVKNTLSLAGGLIDKDIDVESLLSSAAFLRKSLDDEREFNYEITDVEEDGENATVEVSINDDENRVNFSLIQVDGTWYISDYSD